MFIFKNVWYYTINWPTNEKINQLANAFGFCRLQLCLFSFKETCTQQLYPHNRLIFVHRTQDVTINSRRNQEFTPVPPNEGKHVRINFCHKYIITKYIFTLGKLLLSCIFFLQCTQGCRFLMKRIFVMEYLLKQYIQMRTVLNSQKIHIRTLQQTLYIQ